MLRLCVFCAYLFLVARASATKTDACTLDVISDLHTTSRCGDVVIILNASYPHVLNNASFIPHMIRDDVLSIRSANMFHKTTVYVDGVIFLPLREFRLESVVFVGQQPGATFLFAATTRFIPRHCSFFDVDVKHLR